MSKHLSKSPLKPLKLALRELTFHKRNFALSLISVMFAVGALVAVLSTQIAHERDVRSQLQKKSERTAEVLADIDRTVEQAMARLGFNLVILPREQQLGDWYRDDYAAVTMAETTVDALKQATPKTIERMVPVLRWRLKWPEQNRTVIALGVGEEAASIPESDRLAFVGPVAPGAIHVGYLLHTQHDIEVGDDLLVKGQPFQVTRLMPPRGRKDDVTLMMRLKDAQDLLGKQDEINEILALQSPEAWRDLPAIRREITTRFPGLQIIERKDKALMNFKARRQVAASKAQTLANEKTVMLESLRARWKIALAITGLACLVACIWLAFLSLDNVAQRRHEIGVLRALGHHGRAISQVFLWRTLIASVAGSLLGYGIAKTGLGLLADHWRFEVPLLLIGLAMALAIGSVAATFSIVRVLRLDPARVLSND